MTGRKIAHFLSQLHRLHMFLRRHRPEYVYYYFAQTRPGLVKDLLVTSVVAYHGSAILLHLRGSNFRRFYEAQPDYIRPWIRTLLRRGDRILVQSECLKGMFDGIVDRRKIGVLGNGLEQRELMIQGRHSSVKDAPMVFFLGQLSYAKGYFDLLLALPHVVSHVPGVRFVFAGERIPLSAERNIHLQYIRGTWAPNDIVARAGRIEKEYADHIHYPGVIDTPTRSMLMAQADLFVLPTYSEGFSNAVLEAMGSGLPVVTTPIGAHPDLFEDTPEALVPAGDPGKLAQRMVSLLKDGSLRKQYGGRNREQVIQRYTMDRMAAQFVQAVERAV